MKKLIKCSPLYIVTCLVFAGCAYMTASTSRITTLGTNGVPIVTETTKGTTYAILDANASLAKVTVHSGYTTNGTYSPGINASGVNGSSTTTNAVNIINALAGLLGKIPM